MADITGRYALHTLGGPATPGYVELRILGVDAAGRLSGSLHDAKGDQTGITGTYNDVTNQIVFNDASFPGDYFYTTFFTGSAIVVPTTTEVFALAGTWHQWRFQITVSGITGVEFDSGGWYADCKQPIIS
jgi:hypothetical protein